MKRVILTLIFLISISIANAQSLTIGNQEISIIVLLPIIFIIIIGIVFGLLFIKDNLAYSSKIKTAIVKKEPVTISTKEKTVEIEKTQWINYLDVVDTFVKRVEGKEIKDSFSNIIRIIKEFFKDRFSLNYEFTYEELLKELKNRSFEKTELIKYLIDLTYKDNKITKEEIYFLANKFRELVNLIDRKKLEEIAFNQMHNNLKLNKTQKIITNIQSKENKIDTKLNDFIQKERNKLFHSTPKFKKNFDEFDRKKLEQISFLVNNSRIALEEKDLNKLKELYGDICYLFPFLSDKSKKAAYLEILELYEDINKELYPNFFKKLKI